MPVDQNHVAYRRDCMASEGKGALRGSFQYHRRLLDELRGRKGLHSLNHNSPSVTLRAVLRGSVEHTFVNERHSTRAGTAHVSLDRVSGMCFPRSPEI